MSRVLVVEDERRLATFVARGLEAEGLGADICADGPTGLATALNGHYDLVVLDLMLPGLDGVSLLRNLLLARPDQQVLVLSALSDVNERVRCLRCGAADFLGKPFSLDELLARVAARLRATGTTATTGSGMRLDHHARTADVGHGPVGLSGREYRVLAYLVTHGDTVCSREQILADVWGYWFDPGSNVVDVVVRRLRTKLGNDLIETVRNVGYRLTAA